MIIMERDEPEKADFDEIIDGFASLTVRKVLFQWACCIIYTRKYRVYWLL